MNKKLLTIGLVLAANILPANPIWNGKATRISIDGKQIFGDYNTDLFLKRYNNDIYILHQFNRDYLLFNKDGILTNKDTTIIFMVHDSQFREFEEYIYSRENGKFKSLGVFGILNL
jgi:hypothetical protein